MGKVKSLKKRSAKVIRDRHILYNAAVQSVDADIDFFQRVYKRKRGKPFHLLKEDFCGTAALSCTWVKRGKNNEAWGVDLDRPTLDWGIKHYVPTLDGASDRLHLICDDVMAVTEPAVDVVAALNFSYSVFKTRPQLLTYFKKVRQSLLDGGVFFLDLLGGTETMDSMVERRRIPAETTMDGIRVPAFTYVWDQVSFNPINHDLHCRIHFRLPDGKHIKRAFDYDWRLWTLPELQELMLEAGFAGAEVYLEGWDDDEDEADGIYRRRTKAENQSAWVAYVVGLV